MTEQQYRIGDFIVEAGFGFYRNTRTDETFTFDDLEKVFGRDLLLQILLGRRSRRIRIGGRIMRTRSEDDVQDCARRTQPLYARRRVPGSCSFRAPVQIGPGLQVP
jgi:hypothetical protein